MISFACKTISLQDIIMCSFELTKTEYEVFTHLMKCDENKYIAQTSKEMRLERSTVQKALAGLLKKKLIERRQINIAGGGYKYIYSVTDKPAIKKRLESVVDKWHASVHKAITSW